DKYYPQVQSSGESDFKGLARKIQKNTGQNYADVVGVLAALEDVLPEELKAGMIVRLGSVGSLYTTFKSAPADSPEAVNAGNIGEVRVRFRPARGFLKAVNHEVQLVKASATAPQPVAQE